MAYVVEQVAELLADEHELRRITVLEDGETLRLLFDGARSFAGKLCGLPNEHKALRSLIAQIIVHRDRLELSLSPRAMGLDGQTSWSWNILLPSRKPFREAKVRIDAKVPDRTLNDDLLALLVDAKVAKELVLANPELSLNQLGKKESRCRTHLARLLQLALLNPRIVEAIATGTQPDKLNRHVLTSNAIPLDWAEQERQFGLSA